MCISGVSLAIVTDLKKLKEVLQELNVDGKHWWIDAIGRDYVSVGHGVAGCSDVLNCSHYHLRLIRAATDMIETDNLIVLDPSMVYPAELGFYLDDCRFVRDTPEGIQSFFRPLWQALIGHLITVGEPWEDR